MFEDNSSTYEVLNTYMLLLLYNDLLLLLYNDNVPVWLSAVVATQFPQFSQDGEPKPLDQGVPGFLSTHAANPRTPGMFWEVSWKVWSDSWEGAWDRWWRDALAACSGGERLVAPEKPDLPTLVLW